MGHPLTFHDIRKSKHAETRQLFNLTFILRNTRAFTVVSYAHKSSRRRSWDFEFGGIYPQHIKYEQLEYF